MTRPVCLDLTRLVSRVGTGPWTGIDRVEAAYLRELLARDIDLFALVRTSAGLSLLDRGGVAAMAERLDGRESWDGPDLAARLSRFLSKPRRGAEATVRRLAIANAVKRWPAPLRRSIPAGAHYLNAGHANLMPETGRALGRGSRVSVMIHDVIPLTLPDTQRAGTVQRFVQKFRAAAEMADEILVPSRSEGRNVTAALERIGQRCPVRVVPLGIDPVGAMREPAPLADPYLVTLGTIEPRKNHALLLEIWDRLGDAAPTLVIIGRRGWCAPAFFDRLDALKARAGRILEFNEMDDTDRDRWLAGATALLAPSMAEGFGFAPVEAVLRGVVPVCLDLPVYRETVGNNAVYLKPQQIYNFVNKIREPQGRAVLKKKRADLQAGELSLPTWNEHLNRVLNGTL